MRAAILAIASLLVFPAWAQTDDRLVGTWKLVSVSSSTASGERNDTPVVRQIVVRHIKRISFSLAEVLRFGIAC
jgi:hypothetical protein